MRAPHKAHRFRIVSRCVTCHVRLLGACSYRTCAVTTIFPIRHRDGCTTPWIPRPTRVRTRRSLDLVAAARAIFGSDLIDALPLREDQ